jgi:HTH-type transcriptional regulator, transcriptional repressor of NAD biosynthesis genes
MHSYEHALVVGKFAPLHRGHQLVLDAACDLAPMLTVVLWSNPDFAPMPNEVRAGWVRTLYPDATVIIGADGPRNDAPDSDQRRYVARLLADRGLRPDVVVSSEIYGPALAECLGAAHESVDQGRTRVPVSGTRLRADVHAERGFLDGLVYRHFVERVVFLGAESTGKSTLAERMAAEFDSVFVAEYGRDHYAERGGKLGLDDYVTIAVKHRELEDDAACRANRWLFVDTNAITTMFFSHYYNRESRPELRALAADCGQRYHHVIVCDDDIPFEQDGWRDNEVWRGRMQGMVLHDLAVRGISYSTVRGSLDERVEQVSALLDRA